MATRGLGSLVSLVLSAALATGPARAAAGPEANRRNAPLLRWVHGKTADLRTWLARRGQAGGPPDYIDFHLPTSDSALDHPSSRELTVASRTKQLYDLYFPPQDPSSALGTFFESGHPAIDTPRGPYQWDSIAASGMDDPARFEEAVRSLVSRGIKNIRLAPNLHELKPGDRASFEPFLARLETIWRAGGTPTVSVAFFPSLRRWETRTADGAIDYARSYLLHPRWSEELGALARELMELVRERAERIERETGQAKRYVVNPINEPETLAGFNRQFWHGAHAPWSSPETMRYYVPSLLNIAEANVRIRLATERTANGRRVLYMHNEAMTPAYYPSHHGGGRFAVSKFMLGDDLLSRVDWRSLAHAPLAVLERRLRGRAGNGTENEVEWAFREYVFGAWNATEAEKEAARADLVGRFTRLREAHASLLRETGKAMKTDTMLALDYYYQTEFKIGRRAEEIARDLAADRGAKLREALGVTDDAALASLLANASPHGPAATSDLRRFDFAEYLRRDGYAALSALFGFRRSYAPTSDAAASRLRARVGIADALRDPEHPEAIDAALEALGQDPGRLETYFGRRAERLAKMAPSDRTLALARLLGLRPQLQLGFEPQFYARQIRLGVRRGFTPFFMEYVNALRIFTAGVGESGTPYYTFAPMLHDQVLIEYAAALKSGIFGTQYALGPAVDTKGWGKSPLAMHYLDDHETNPSGILQWSDGPDGTRHLTFRGDDGGWFPRFSAPLLGALVPAKRRCPELLHVR